MSIEAMKQALAKFEHLWEIGIDAEYKVELLPEIEALRQAIEQAEYDNLTVKFGERAKEYLEGAKKSWQEPVAWIKVWDEKEKKHVLMNYYITPPPKREIDMSTKPEKIDTSAERVHETDKSVHEEIERLKTEIKRLKDLAEYRLQLLMRMPENKPVMRMLRKGEEPPKREWVGLTDEEIIAVNKQEGTCWEVPDKHAITISKAIEAKLRERNT